MIIEKYLSETRVRHYSDSGMMIRQMETGVLYEDAVDDVPCRYTYEETDVPIPDEDVPGPEDEPTIEDKAEAYDILMGANK